MAKSSQLLQLPRENRQPLPVYLASGDGAGKRPAVIVVHEIFGLNEHIRDISDRFAAEGFVALAPDLFAGAPGLPEDRNDLNAMRAVWQAIPDSQLIADLQAVQKMATERPDVSSDKIGTIGYCMGGAIAFMFACSGSGIAWVADYYGRIFYPQLSDTKPKHPIDYASDLQCATLGIFAGQDELITAEHIAEFERRLKQRPVRSEVIVYGNARHAFFNDQREFYDERAAKDAWRKTLDFIKDSINVPAGR